VRKLPDGEIVNHTLAIGSLGGATLDNEENYLIKKIFGAGLGMVCIENQARICHANSVPSLGRPSGAAPRRWRNGTSPTPTASW
jgi:formate dehydrogenase major subunit